MTDKEVLKKVLQILNNLNSIGYILVSCDIENMEQITELESPLYVNINSNLTDEEFDEIIASIVLDKR